MGLLADKSFRMLDLSTARGRRGLKSSESPGLTVLNVLDLTLGKECYRDPMTV
jgi:hypothetical protein